MKTQFNRNLLKPILLGVLIVLAIVLASAAPTLTLASPNAAPKAAIVNETFKNTTATGWVLSDSACLTANSTTLACSASPNNEGNGNGWLRLTSATVDQKASAIYNTAFPSTNGIQVQFQYATYGGTAADGISFYLIDGSTAVPTTGAAGGGLGYSFNTVTPVGNGVTGGYAAVALDEYGNFGNTGYSDNPCFVNTVTPGIKIAGSGNNVGGPVNSGRNAYNCLAHFNTPTIPTTNRAGAKWVRLTILPLAVGVIVQTSPDAVTWTTVIPSFNLSTQVGQVAIPATFKMGFSGSTGGSTNFHEIRYLTVTGAYPTTTTPVCAPNPAYPNQNVTCNATVAGNPQIGGNIPTGTVDFYSGTTLVAQGVAVNGSGVASFSFAAGAVGTYPFTTNYSGDSIYAASSGSTNLTVQKIDPTVALVSSINPSVLGQSVTFTCNVTGGTSPTGSVNFTEGQTSLCSNVTLNNGSATCTTSTLAIGTHPILCHYNGDSSNNTADATLFNQVVIAPAPKDVPEGDTLLLLGGGLSGVGVWLRYQWNKRRKQVK